MVKIRLVLIFVVVLVPFQYTYSQELDEPAIVLAKKTSKKTTKKKPSEKSKRANASANNSSSRSIRSRKNSTISARAGLLIGGFSGAGGEYLYGISEDFQVGVFGAAGTYDLKPLLDDYQSLGISYDKAETSYSLFYGQARYFVGNSFFVNGGIGQRSFTSTFAISDNSGNSLDLSTEASSIIAQFGIGNIWSFDFGMVLGCEWIGYTQPLSSSYSSTISAKGVVSGYIQDLQGDAEKLAKTTAESGTAMALVGSLGFAF